MTEVHVRSYEELERYLRGFTTWHGEKTVYDGVGAFHLWVALLENLKEREEEIEDHATMLNEEQIRFLEHMVDRAKRGDEK